MMTGVTVRCLMMLNALSDHAFFFDFDNVQCSKQTEKKYEK